MLEVCISGYSEIQLKLNLPHYPTQVRAGLVSRIQGCAPDVKIEADENVEDSCKKDKS